MTAGNGTVKEQELVITRLFDAPRERVWQAWTEPERMMQWWGPKGYTSPVSTMNLRVGGKYVHCMRSPDGQDFWSTGVYQEVTAPERLVMTDSFANKDGNPVPASHYGMSTDLPLEMRIVVTFTEHGGQTTMTLQHIGMPAGEMRGQAQAGWNESFDKLAAVLNT